MPDTKEEIKRKNTLEWNQNNPCVKCEALCCKDVAVALNTPKTRKDWEQIRWLVAHENVHIYKDHDNDWLIEFFTKCEKLDEKNMCKIYHTRPQTCYEHSHENCVFHDKGEYYKIIFKHLEDVDEYLAKKNFKWFKRNKN